MFPTMPPPPQRLLIFARIPERGRVKTRLAAGIGEERALAVYEAMLRDALESIGASTDDTEVEVLWAPTPAASGEVLRRAFGERSVSIQTGETLTERLAMAFSERFFFHQTEKMIAVGVDDPILPRTLIDDAFGLLDSCDYVLGPAADGGYYLVGCRAPVFDVGIFSDVEWGTSDVFAATLQKIRRLQRNVAVLPLRHDIDVADDLRTFARTAAGGSLLTLLQEWQWR